MMGSLRWRPKNQQLLITIKRLVFVAIKIQNCTSNYSHKEHHQIKPCSDSQYCLTRLSEVEQLLMETTFHNNECRIKLKVDKYNTIQCKTLYSQGIAPEVIYPKQKTKNGAA